MAEGVPDPVIEVDRVGYGRPATAALGQRIAAFKQRAGGHPLDAVTVVVPSNSAALSARRLLATGDPRTGLAAVNLASVDFVTPFRLAELLGSAHMGDRRPLTNAVLAAAVRSALREAPGIFAPVADHQATQAAVMSLYGELSRALPETCERIATSSRRGAEVVRVVDLIRTHLDGFFDEDDLAAVARGRLESDPDAAAVTGALIWHLPDVLTPALAGLVGTALRRAPSSAAVVGLTGDDAADAAIVETVRNAGVPLDALTTDALSVPHGHRIVSVSDTDEEVRHVVREIVGLVQAGTPLDRIAIFRPAPGSYGRTILEQLDGAGIPHNGPATRRLADTAAGRTLLAALDLPANGWGRSEVMTLVAEAPIRSGDQLAPSRRWDAISRRAGVVGGLDDWLAKLAETVADLQATVAEIEAAETIAERRLSAVRGDLEAALSLSAFVSRLAAGLAAVDSATTWADRAEAARSLLAGLLSPEHRRLTWPDLEVTAAQRVDEALERLGALDDIEAGPTRSAFEMAVAAELDVPVGRVGRFGQGVLVAPLASAVGLDLDAVFILGMAEGTCPSIRHDEALLPDVDRRNAAGGELATQQERLRAQHRSYLAALAAGGTQRTLLFPRGDLRARRERQPSRWLLQTASALVGHPVYSSQLGTLPDHVLSTVASYIHGVQTARVHGSIADRDVAALVAVDDPLTHPLVRGLLARGIEARRSRASAEFTEWDGNLIGHMIPAPAEGTVLSPSRLELWAGCPFRYFLSQVLRLAERDDPEREVELNPAERGTLVHLILERFFAEVLQRTGGPPAPTQPWTETDRTRMIELAHVAFAEVEKRGITGRPLTWRRTKADVLADLDRFLTKDDEHRRDGGLVPTSVEMSFGNGDESPVTIELRSGRTLRFRGKVDRVDQTEDGAVTVIDYKTGSASKFKQLDADPVNEGTVLQLGVYAEAARARFGANEIDALFWMVSEKGEFKKHGGRWDDDDRTRFLEVADAIAEGIESGIFPANPGEYDSFWGSHQHCGHCDFDRICPRDRDDHQRATAGAPELAILKRLAMPEEDS